MNLMVSMIYGIAILIGHMMIDHAIMFQYYTQNTISKNYGVITKRLELPLYESSLRKFGYDSEYVIILSSKTMITNFSMQD